MTPCVNASTSGLREKLTGSKGYELNRQKSAVGWRHADESGRGKRPNTDRSTGFKAPCQQRRRVTTATPEQTQERSDERALAVAKMLDQCAFIERGVRAFGRIASTIVEKCGALPVVIAWLGCSSVVSSQNGGVFGGF